MMTSNQILNKVETSGILTVDPYDFRPTNRSVPFDLKTLLFHELIIQEKHFKECLQSIEWSQYANKPVAVFCSVDTIVPPWTYMMIASHLEVIASDVFFGPHEIHNLYLWKQQIEQADFNELKDKKVVIRAHVDLDPSIFVACTTRLKPVVKTLMYGEAGLPKVIWKN
ncbi:DUF2480 family protein [Marinoscillum sp.]|uniref:DUF2480 family protein n=1 Tax=Marinoscillum sp. TaxID=2024838 RepID=UPI003BAAC657